MTTAPTSTTNSKVKPEDLEAMRQLMQEGANDVARLPEPLFVQHLLPLLTNRTGAPVDLTLWQQIAGHVMRPIDVIDGTGDVLFRVPPLVGSPKLRNGIPQRDTMAAISAQAGARSTQHPALGETFLQNRLAGVPVESRVDWTVVRQWNAILARYNLPPLVELGEKAAVEAAPEKSSTARPVLSDQQDDF